MADLAPGVTFGHYEIVATLGVGGMGEVYLAIDPRLDRQVAIKVISREVADDPDRLRRFQREAKAASKLNHPNIAHIYEIGECDGRHFIAMEYVRGESLGRRIGGRPMPIADVIVYATQIADALDEAHGQGIIHRDLKPSNAVISVRGRLKILDFGLAKIVDEASSPDSVVSTADGGTVAGLVLGTLEYMSPEQVRGLEVDRRTDIFSFGVMLYEMITGRLPFTGASRTDTVYRITQAQPDAVSRFAYDVPQDLERIVRKCLEKEPQRRYQAMRELLVDLSAIRRDSSSAVMPAAPRFSLRPRQRLWLAVGVIGLAFSAGSGAMFTYLKPDVIDSLAVVPVYAASADRRVADLTEGLAASLVNSLSMLPRLKVAPRQLSFAASRDNPDNPLEVARRLNMHAALLVSVVPRGESAVLDIQLVDVIHPAQEWGHQETKSLVEIELAQESISTEVAEMLRLRLSAEDRREQEVYQLTQRGRFYANKRTEPDLRKALDLYEQAIQKDRDYAPGYAGLAYSYNLLQTFSGMAPKEAFTNAKRSAEKALSLDSSLADAHTQLAWVFFRWEWDWPNAEREFTEAVALEQNDAQARHWMAVFLSAMGRTDEAMGRIREAQVIDPLSPIYRAEAGWTLYMARRYEESVAESLKAIEAHPQSWVPYRYLGLAQEQLGHFSQSVDAFSQALALEGWKSTLLKSELAHAYAAAGRRSEAGNLLSELSAAKDKQYVSPYSFAIAAAGLGDIDGALSWLDAAFRDRVNNLVWLKVDPRLDPLRTNARFIKLLGDLRLQ